MIVLCCGVFDLFHVAHKRHLEQASEWGDIVVGVTMDVFVKKPGRPIIPQAERLEIIKSLKFVIDARLCLDSLDALAEWQPDIFVKGSDYRKKGLLDSEVEFCTKNGIEIRFTDPNPQTTSGIIERIHGHLIDGQRGIRRISSVTKAQKP
jgi:D-beta-D-heptose 7-phosphate kinase/D-beta-D-heptose 1-phosphate adenosyltransferase